MSKPMTFIWAWLQVSLIAINTYQIANTKWIGAFVVGFFISLVWTLNVKRIAISTWQDRFIYAFGAATGTITGLLISTTIYA